MSWRPTCSAERARSEPSRGGRSDMSVLVMVMLLRMFMGAWTAPASSLGELALREAVRRQAVSASTRKLTDADIGPAPERVARPATTTIPLPLPLAGDPAKPDEK